MLTTAQEQGAKIIDLGGGGVGFTPGRAGAAEEHSWSPVPEPLGVPLGLGHPFGQARY